MPLPRIKHKRQSLQLILILSAFILPFITMSGNPVLRMDIDKMTLFLAGIPFRIDQFYLVLFVVLLLVAVILLMTVVLGRVWCGWFCPQTLLNDILDLIVNIFKNRAPKSVKKAVEHSAAITIATLVSFDLLCWFMSPQQIILKITTILEHPLLLTTFLLTTVFGYLNLILVKRSFCRSFCPYGRLQTALMDSGTLNLSFLEETRDRCLRCNACVRTCPMGIDIRAGFQIECINCGRCIDACRTIMERKPDAIGLIGYRFGKVKGVQFRLGNMSVALLVVTILLAVGLVFGVLDRSQSSFAVQRVATADVRKLPDGSLAQPWRAIIGNRSESPQIYSIQIECDASKKVELLGQIRDIKIPANQHQEVVFMLHMTNITALPEKIIIQLIRGDQPVGKTTIIL